ncbi:MAG: hypothetical protein IJI66_16770 [Erysipelotrichaceae bacterium]|nr:hypothetical protein [Erysipelotrichaceae bacterium]
MKPGDKAYFVETGNVREAEVLKINGDFVTLRFRYPDPNSGPRHTVYQNGGLRLRKSRVFESKEEAQKSIR